MKTTIEKVTVDSPKICTRLLEYMNRVASYDNFDDAMICRVYVDDACDFIAFESLKYNVQFTSNYKKLIAIKNSVYEPITCKFVELMKHVASMDYLPFEE